MSFRIKEGYQENPGPMYFVDAPQGDLVYQPDVIPAAERLALELGVTSIVDVGCGWAEKLAALHDRQPDWNLIGVDFGPNIDHCFKQYDWGTWLDLDLEQPPSREDLQYPEFNDAIVVASDVIEHLVDPRPMLAWLREESPVRVLFSTPERDLQNGVDHMGPCPNPYHVREWNLSELVTFLEDEGFTIDHAGLTVSCEGNPDEQTILIAARP